MHPFSYRDGMTENNNNSSGNDSIMQVGIGNRPSCFDDPDEFFRNLPPGCRFVPTDTELVQEYLLKKVMDRPDIPRNRIHEENVYKSNPDELASKHKLIRESDWYFFTSLERKYSNGSRPNRSAAGGYWKATGCETKIRNNGTLIGLRRNLDFYKGEHPRGERTDWKMHEYKLDAIYASQNGSKPRKTDEKQLDTVLCKIYKNRNRRREAELESQGHEGTITFYPDVVMLTEAGAPPVANQIINSTILGENDFNGSNLLNNLTYNGSSVIDCDLPGYGEQSLYESCNQVGAVNMESHMPIDDAPAPEQAVMHPYVSGLPSMGWVRYGHQVGGGNMQWPMVSQALEPSFMPANVSGGIGMGLAYPGNQVGASLEAAFMLENVSGGIGMGLVYPHNQVGGDNMESPMPSHVQRAPEPAFLLPQVPRGTGMGSLDY